MRIKALKQMVGGICLASLLMTAGSVRGITLNLGNSGLAGYSGPFATLGVSLVDSDTAQFTFTGLDWGGYHYLIGGAQAIALNINGSVSSFSIVSYTQPQTEGGAPVAPVFTSAGSGNADGWGTFSFRLDNQDSYKQAVRSLVFTVNKTSGTWASDADVLIPNSIGVYSAAAHIIVTRADTKWSNTDATGYAASGNGGGTSTPDGGSTIAILGAALIGVDFLRRKFIKD